MTKTSNKVAKNFPFFAEKFHTLREGDKKWIAIWLMIYLSFITLDLLFPKLVFESTVLKYSGTFLCMIYAFSKYKKDTRLHLAMVMTLLSDTILLFLGAKAIGLFTFLFAQFFHTLRLSNAPSKFLTTYFIMVFVILSFGILQGISPIYIMAFIYVSNFLLNIHLSYEWRKKEPNSMQANCCLYGFLLYFACDVCVGISYLGWQGMVPAAIASVASFLVYTCYYPGQVLISNSSNYRHEVSLK